MLEWVEKIYDFMYAQAMNGGTAYESAASDFGDADIKNGFP